MMTVVTARPAWPWLRVGDAQTVLGLPLEVGEGTGLLRWVMTILGSQSQTGAVTMTETIAPEWLVAMMTAWPGKPILGVDMSWPGRPGGRTTSWEPFPSVKSQGRGELAINLKRVCFYEQLAKELIIFKKMREEKEENDTLKMNDFGHWRAMVVVVVAIGQNRKSEDAG